MIFDVFSNLSFCDTLVANNHVKQSCEVREDGPWSDVW